MKKRTLASRSYAKAGVKIFSAAMLIVTAISFSQCGDDEKPKTSPEVITGTPTNILAESVTLNGEISDDGNAKITERGFVYSDIVDEPEITDNKLASTDTEDEFSALLEGLEPSTTYHIRAYAKNSKGIGYGEVEDVLTGNAAPTATNLSVSGSMEVNKTVTAAYTYSDAENDPQGATTIQWYVANDAAGAGEVAIVGATAQTYLIQATEQGKFLSFGVIAKATSGSTTGVEVKSAYTTAVGEATTVTDIYNGQSVTYGILVSAATGKRWLDRNLGAANVASSASDFTNFGDSFQWGRRADGHQIITRTSLNEATWVRVNGSTSATAPYEFSNTDTPPHSKFIIVGSDTPELPWNWRKPDNNNMWQGEAGTNNPCPSGFRLPTQAEFAAEGITSVTNGFTKLKFTVTALRWSGDGNFYGGDTGYYWTSTLGPITDTHGNTTQSFSVAISLTPTEYQENAWDRSRGFGVRCIKE